MIERLEAGIIPWQIPWRTGTGLPQNMVCRKVYKGFNFWYLLTLAEELDSPFFLTYRQVQDLGGHVVKGERGFPVIFWKILENEQENGDIRQVPLLRYYTVFNLKQTEGIDKNKIPRSGAYDHEFHCIQDAENLVKAWSDCPDIRVGECEAYYHPVQDYVGIPAPETFYHDEQFYSALFHELVHSTGHRKRLGRHEKLANHQFGSDDYSQEELVAEMGAAFLCRIAGIENVTLDNSAAYIQSWLRQFKNDKKMVLTASSQAQKAVDYILEHHLDGDRLLV